MSWQERLIDLKTAISHIQQAREFSSGEPLKGKESPFFFIVGSGVSYPPVPLASMIIEHCKGVVSKWNREQAQAPENPMQQYSYYFNQAYPQPKQRQGYLRSLIEGKTISKANLRLAHLLSEDSFTDLVVTPNFDDFLARGLALFGKSHIICDHRLTISRLDAAKSEDIKIVQVHGSYWFYDCANLSDEIVDRAQRPEETTQSMASYLDGVLASRSPLVVGYSGWEGDVIMSALKRRLQNPLGMNLYWFCYKRSNAEDLPKWLKDHANVYFVVPPSAPSQGDEKRASLGSTLDDERQREMTLSGQDVLDALIQAYSLPAPRLTKEPLSFFADQLAQSLLLGEDDTTPDLYLVKDVIERMRRAEKLLNQEIVKATVSLDEQSSNVENKTEDIRNALRRLSYNEAADKVVNLLETERDNLSQKQLLELRKILMIQSHEIRDNAQLALIFYDLLIQTVSILQSQGTIDGESFDLWFINFSIEKGEALGQLGRYTEEIAIYEHAETQYGKSIELPVKERTAHMLINKAIALSHLERFDEAIHLLDEVESRLKIWCREENETHILLMEAARALVSKGVVLTKAKLYDKALTIYSEIERYYGGAEFGWAMLVQAQVFRAILDKAILLKQLNRLAEAIHTCVEIERRYLSTQDSFFLPIVEEARKLKNELNGLI